MAASLQVRVITPEKVVFEGSCTQVQYPGEDGLYGVLANHAPMVTTVDAGVITLKQADGSEEHLFVSSGFAQVARNELRFAVNSGEVEGEIDMERAERAATRARERIAQSKQSAIDSIRAQASLRRALMRMRAKRRRS